MLATPRDFSRFPWMQFAFQEYGQAERSGVTDNARIVQYLASVGLASENDETPWCAAFVNWCLLQARAPRTRLANARSFLAGWDGQCLSRPSYGCIVVFTRPPNPLQGHVALYTGPSGGDLLVLGGNQANKVCLKPYPAMAVLGYRLPAGFEPAYGL